MADVETAVLKESGATAFRFGLGGDIRQLPAKFRYRVFKSNFKQLSDGPANHLRQRFPCSRWAGASPL